MARKNDKEGEGGREGGRCERWGGKTWLLHHTDTYLLFWLKVERLLTARQCLCGVWSGWGGREGCELGMGRRGRRGGKGNDGKGRRDGTCLD
jgi:hypothetical protein